MPLASVADNVTVTEDVYQLLAPLLPEALYVVTGGMMSLVLPGETVYVEGVELGIVTVRPPTGEDCALRIRFVPPLFVRVTLYVALGVKPEPSNTTAATLWSWNATPAAERLLTSRFASEPVQEACRLWESAVLAVSKTTTPPTIAERLSALPDHAKVALVAAGEVTKRTGMRPVFVIPGPRSTTVPWKPVGRRIGAMATVEYVVS